MDYDVIERETAEQAKKAFGSNNWIKVLESLTRDKAIRISCPDNKTLRKYQPRIYEAAFKCHKRVETFKTTENGSLFLNILLGDK